MDADVCVCALHGSGVKLDDGPDLKLFIKGPESFSLLLG